MSTETAWLVTFRQVRMNGTYGTHIQTPMDTGFQNLRSDSGGAGKPVSFAIAKEDTGRSVNFKSAEAKNETFAAGSHNPLRVNSVPARRD